MIIESHIIKDFLKRKDVVQDLEDKNINNLYNKLRAFNGGDGFETGLLTYLLKEIGIDPLDYLDYIPSNYLALLNDKDLYVPKNIKSINPYALFGSEITTIHYKGTEEEWEEIKKGFRWDDTANKRKPIRIIYEG